MSKLKVLFSVGALLLGSGAWAKGGAAEKTVTIRTMAQEGIPIKYQIENPAKPGICVEIIHALENVDPELHFTGYEAYATQKRLEQDLESGTLDFFCGMKKNEERAKRFAFLDSPVLYRQSYWLVARADDNVKISNLDDIRKLGKDGVVMVNQGNSQSIYMKAQPGIIVDDGSLGTKENLKKLVAGRGRFYCGSNFAIHDFMDDPELKGKFKRLTAISLPDEDLLGAFSKKVPQATIDRFAAALKKIEKSGKLKKIVESYL